MLPKLIELHQELFGTDTKLRKFFAPGRINLIGEHTDRNGGHVFPCALDIGTFAVISPRVDSKICIYSTNFSQSGIVTFDLTNPITHESTNTWINYPKGICKIFLDNGYSLPYGLNIVIGGNIPNGAGLSSSASIEMLIAVILNNIYQFNLPPLTLVKWGQETENNFIQVNSGIMDQFASMMGKKDHAILLNCGTLDYKYAPLHLGDNDIIIANTNKQRGLSNSKYNERVTECQRALKDLQQKFKITNLCELDEQTFLENEHLITNPDYKLRAKHVISENSRTLKAIAALNDNDLIEFGKLMNQSHLSLKDNYAVTGAELDALAFAAWQETGCIGSRMTGAGFGGCTVSIVNKLHTNNFIYNVGQTYYNQTKLKADFYIARIDDGAREIYSSSLNPGLCSYSRNYVVSH